MRHRLVRLPGGPEEQHDIAADLWRRRGAQAQTAGLGEEPPYLRAFWLGNLAGGTVIDPQGPPSNPIGLKVIRGGGYDFAEPDCRSARRYFFASHSALNDTDLGSRVVLACP